jgi:hypothetical protein
MILVCGARASTWRRLVLFLAAFGAALLAGCDNCCLHKKGGQDWALVAAGRANGAGGSGGTGGGNTGGGGGGGGGGGQVPEIRAEAAGGVLTLVFGAILILRDRRRTPAGIAWT